MHIGVTLRNMGPQSQAHTLLGGAQQAEQLGFESLWITDHLAIPPDDAEGSEGRYLDPLVTLAWLAQATSTIRLGTGVLIVPYRPALPTAKAIATLVELSDQRLELGVGIGWMDPEFRALGVDRHQRGRVTDQTLQAWRRWFSEEPANANGQDFLFRPKPERPKIHIGGRAPHALTRAANIGDGWLPMARAPGDIAEHIPRYKTLAKEAGNSSSEVSVMTALPSDNVQAARALIDQYQQLGVDRLVCTVRYETLDEYCRAIEALAEVTLKVTL